MAWGSLFALLALALAAVAAQLLPPGTPFEPVELVVSLFLLGWALWSFAPVTRLSFKWNALAAIILTVMLLGPRPVVHSSGAAPSAVENALFWFPIAGGYFVQKAMLLTVALVAALKIARSKSEKGEEIDESRTMFFLFGFSVSFGAINSLSSVVLVLGVLLAADRLLFSRDAPKPRTDQSDTGRALPARTFAPGRLRARRRPDRGRRLLAAIFDRPVRPRRLAARADGAGPADLLGGGAGGDRRSAAAA